MQIEAHAPLVVLAPESVHLRAQLLSGFRGLVGLGNLVLEFPNLHIALGKRRLALLSLLAINP